MHQRWLPFICPIYKVPYIPNKIPEKSLWEKYRERHYRSNKISFFALKSGILHLWSNILVPPFPR